MSDVKWEIDTLTATVGRLHLTVSAPTEQQNWRWFWQVWGDTTRMDGEKASGNADSLEEAQTEAVRHLARQLRDGTGWDESCAVKIARALGLTSHPIPYGTHCPVCPEPKGHTYAASRTVLSLPDRYVAECTACASQWVRLTERRRLEPFRTRAA